MASKVTASPPNIGRSISSYRHLGFRLISWPPARPPPLGLPQLAECGFSRRSALALLMPLCGLPLRSAGGKHQHAEQCLLVPEKQKHVLGSKQNVRNSIKFTDSRHRGPGGTSSEDFPLQARSAYVHNAMVRSSSHQKRATMEVHRYFSENSTTSELKTLPKKCFLGKIYIWYRMNNPTAYNVHHETQQKQNGFLFFFPPDNFWLTLLGTPRGFL